MPAATPNHLHLLRAQVRELPESPGVYFWHDERDRILYIGKAVNLRSRVSSYFTHARQDRRTRELLMKARTVGFEVTSTELEALFRESALIKSEQPPYNRALKRSRKPFYLKFDGSRTDPYMEVARSKGDQDSLYFGPFRSGAVIRETMAYLHDVLPLRKCTAASPRCGPCIYHQMRRCAAPALDEVHHQQHQDAIQRLFDVLDGRADRVGAWLERKRDRLSEALLFEHAAEVQERLERLRELEAQHHILEAAIGCRCVLIQQVGGAADGPRLLLVARGHVISVRDAANVDTSEVVRWLDAHEPLIHVMERQQTEVDAASVLERWIINNRKTVRWVAIPDRDDRTDLIDRVSYVLRDAGPAASTR